MIWSWLAACSGPGMPDQDDLGTADTSAPEPAMCEPLEGPGQGAVSGAGMGSLLGESVKIGEVTGDGLMDIIVGGPAWFGPGAGSVAVFPPNSVTCNNQLEIRMQGFVGDWFGASLASGDVNGDGFGDLLVGDPIREGWGEVRLYLGPVAPGVEWKQHDAVLEGPSGSRAGMVTFLGDITGDDIVDVAVGASFIDNNVDGHWGRVALLSGPDWAGRMNLDDAQLTVSSTVELDGVGAEPVHVGDLDGDGGNDLIVPASFDPGEVFLFQGPLQQDLTTDDAAQTLLTNAGTLQVGMLGDVTGDGVDDLAVGAPIADANGLFRAGRVWISPGGPFVGDVDVEDLDLHLAGDVEAAGLGRDVVGGDFDGDGQGDLAVGMPGDLYFSEGELGAVLFFLGPLTGPLTVAGADWIQPGEHLDAQFGFTLAAGDLDGDAQTDLVVGAPYDDSGNEDGGRVHTFFAADAF